MIRNREVTNVALYDHIRKPVPSGYGPPPPVPYPAISMPPPAVPPLVARQSSLFDTLGKRYRDLYPYYPADSNLWLELFIIADEMVGPELGDRLEFIRNVGGTLVPDPFFGFTIQPLIDPCGQCGWSSVKQYEDEGRQCLEPYFNKIIEALRELRRRYDSGKIR